MTEDEKPIEVRTFNTMQEVEKIPKFKNNNPVNINNYKEVLGDYDFKDEVKCCREKPNGNLCGTEHQYG
ncbi:MAG: hypothetical protein JAY67_20900, partial [Candidatus Thiodiazotropha taylori]|nr:hypothetical protein [Candidatus Thiodiazotropha taylori]